jgi:hypothetical protein
MPGFQQVYQRYKDEGFHLVAMEKQRHTLETINSLLANNGFLRQAGLQYQITYGDGGTPNQPLVPGHYNPFLPANFLFGPDGNLVATDVDEAELDYKVHELLEDTWQKRITLSTHEIASPALGDILLRLKSGHNMMEALKDLALKRRDPGNAADAAKIFNAVFTAAYSKFDIADKIERNAKPLTALYRFASLARDFKGCELGKDAAKKEAEMRGDPRVEPEIIAESNLRDIINHVRDMRTATGNNDPNNPEFQRVNRTALLQLATECLQLAERFPGTEAGKHVTVIIDDFHLREPR